MKKSPYTPEQLAFGLRQAEKRHAGVGGQRRWAPEADLIPVEKEFPGHGRGLGEAAPCPGGGEPHAEATGAQPQPGQADAPGFAAKKALKLAQLRPRAAYLQVAYDVSERRACQVLTPASWHMSRLL